MSEKIPSADAFTNILNAETLDHDFDVITPFIAADRAAVAKACAAAASIPNTDHGERRAPEFRTKQMSESAEEFLTVAWRMGGSLERFFHDFYEAGRTDAADAIRTLAAKLARGEGHE